ncbi:hypothetical protein CPB83DRAFT_875940 [Crepidotus variabilis]|uniref:Uncharacterized protein n=1 Tax=Crepidotus variabilis TaxID=179855 RepID=A0A9P6JPG2_9AGAR|nr:hypothetical protein CPB83DRAFT_875940 [Crepidotus variabilis]
MAEETKLNPFPSGVLTAEHEAQIEKIRSVFKRWLPAAEDSRKKVDGAKEQLQSVTEDLKNLQIDAPYAYSPAPPYIFRPILLSCTKTYWLAVIAALSDDQKKEMAQRLNCIPPYGKRVPQFDGKRCVEQASELNDREYEGIMRCAMFALINLLPSEVVRFWRELSEVGVQTWEERD